MIFVEDLIRFLEDHNIGGNTTGINPAMKGRGKYLDENQVFNSEKKRDKGKTISIISLNCT